jgi:von Willebrand factor type A domain.
VSFSTAPDVLVLPTTDRSMMREGVDLLEPEAGTAIGDGLKAAVDVALSSVGRHAPRGRNGKIPAAIVLLSDGAQTRGVLRPLQGAQFAKDAGIPVYTIALGTNHGTLGLGAFGGFGFSPSPGARFPVRPDPGILRAIAQVTGGNAFRADSAAKVQNVYRKLSGAVITHTKRREISSWFAGAAAFLLLGSLGAAKLDGRAVAVTRAGAWHSGVPRPPASCVTPTRWP